MMGKISKSEAWNLSDPDRLGLLPHPKVLNHRLSIRICRILAELSHSSKLEPRNLVGPRRIPVELRRLSYDEGSRQVERPSGP
jgi:hypothetical protein